MSKSQPKPLGEHGMWPQGEPTDIRNAYDRQLAEQAQAATTGGAR